MRYTVVLVPNADSDRYVAYVPVLSGCTTFGDTPTTRLLWHETSSRSCWKN